MAFMGEKMSLGSRVLLFPAPFQGHITPMLQLASLLHDEGFSITILHTSFNSPNPANHPHFEFIPFDVGVSDHTDPNNDLMSLISTINANCEAPFRGLLRELLSEKNSRDGSISCVIVDALMCPAQAVARELLLPVLVLRTGGAASFTTFSSLRWLFEQGYLQDPDSDQLDVPMRELPHLRVRDFPRVGENPQDLCRLTDRVIKETKASSGLIFNTCEFLEEIELEKLRRELSVPVSAIGPLHKFSVDTSGSSLTAQDRSCIQWLDKQGPGSVLYVSFGSLACMEQMELLEIAWGLTNSCQPFLLVLRRGSVRGLEEIELPKELEEEIQMRGKIVSWAPQQEVLAHPAVGGFWTHCGWNSTIESICEGVPMLCWPCFGDQMVNTRYVTHVWKVGIRLENGMERIEIERTIRKLMGEEGEQMRARARDIQKNTRLCMKEGGSSHNASKKLVDHILSFSINGPER